MIRPRGAVALAAVLAMGFSLGLAAAAGASSVSNAQLRVLAARAARGDAVALDQLRAVDEISGRPADVAQALRTSDPDALQARLQVLAASPTSVAPPPGDAQAAAAAIVGARRYGTTALPDPIGTALRKIGHFIDRLAARAPGGPPLFWGVLAAFVLSLAALGTRRMIRRLDPADDPQAAAMPGRIDPAALERAAAAAEARGEFDLAIRLRFQAGLLGLSARGAIEYRPSLLTTEARRRLHSPVFDELAGRFEQVAYGGAAADDADASAAREGWRSLLGSRGR